MKWAVDLMSDILDRVLDRMAEERKSTTAPVDPIRGEQDPNYTLVAGRQVGEGVTHYVDIETYTDSSGNKFTREVVKKGDVVALLLIAKGVDPKHKNSEHLVLIEQFRAGAKNSIIEVPAGTVEIGEDPYHCAIRECIEEVGVEPDRMKYLTSFYLSPGWTDELCHLYAAKVKYEDIGERDPQGVEEVNSSLIYLSRASIRSTMDRIRDAKTLVAINFWFHGKAV